MSEEIRTVTEEAKVAMMAEKVMEADSEETVIAILASCPKVSDMARLYEAVAGYSYGERLRGIRREEIEAKMASGMIMIRENSRFKSLSAEEKYEELKTLKELPKKLSLCTMAELEAIAGMLEIDEAAYANKSGYEKKHELASQIMVKLEVKKLEELKTAGSLEEVREMLRGCDTSRLAEIAKMVGSDFSEKIVEARDEHSGAELIDWAIAWIFKRLGAEKEGAKTEMETASEAEPRTEEENPAETEAEEQTASVKPEIAFPLEGHTAASLKNLVNTIYSRGSLMSKATGGNFRASEKLVEELKEYGATVEEALKIIRSAGEYWLNGVKFEEDRVVFTGFPATEDSVKIRAYETVQ